MNIVNKDKKFGFTDFNKHQRLSNSIEKLKIKDLDCFNKNLFYFKKRNFNLNYKTINLLKFFLTKDGKIFSKFQTELKTDQQRLMSKLIKQLRSFKLYPIKCQLTD